MFDYFVKIYNNCAASNDTTEWTTAAKEVDKYTIWNALKGKLDQMDNDRYPFVSMRINEIDEFIGILRAYVNQGNNIYAIYGKNHSEEIYKDLIDLAKVIALYRNDPNYHRVLLGDQLPDERESNYEPIYLEPISSLCPVKVRGNYELVPYADLWEDFTAYNQLRYHGQSINLEQTFDDPDCPYVQEYRRVTGNLCASLSKPTFYALKAFVEVVSNAFDASHSLESCFYRARVSVKYEAFLNLCAYLESLPTEEQNALLAAQITNNYTLGDRIQQVKGGSCASQFADDVTKLVYQCDTLVQFTNPRAIQTIDTQKAFLRLRGEVRETDVEDRNYLENLIKVILNTHFQVRIGTKVTSADGELSNRVPSHVAEMFEYCQKALRGEMNYGEARYKTTEIAAHCYRNPHNSLLFFLNTRHETSHNFYGMTLMSDFPQIIAQDDNVHQHEHFLNRPC